MRALNERPYGRADSPRYKRETTGAKKGDVGTSIARPRMRSMRRLRKQTTRFAYRQIAFVPNAGTLTLTGKSVPYGGAYRAG